jgi:phosphoribosylformylglycinamidine cyclo-ligase
VTPKGTSYRAAGVDVEAGDLVKARMGPAIRSTFGPRVLTDVGPLGSFGGMFSLAGLDVQDPVLVGSADGVGTKLKLAFLLGRHDTIGRDLVNHCLNDVLTTGARPLFFMDYFATGALRPEVTLAVVEGIAAACRDAGCALLGGETAQMPGFYADEEYDLAGFLVGLVGREQILGPARVRRGDVAVCLPSSGMHTNGYSLARRVLGLDGEPAAARRRLEEWVPELERTLGDELLEPHRSYLAELTPLLPRLHALAHVTGGGLLDNLPRALPADLAVRLERRRWHEPPIFALLRRAGDLTEGEMDRAFNRGVGMLALVEPAVADALVRAIPEATVVGEVVAREDGAPVRLER